MKHLIKIAIGAFCIILGFGLKNIVPAMILFVIGFFTLIAGIEGFSTIPVGGKVGKWKRTK